MEKGRLHFEEWTYAKRTAPMAAKPATTTDPLKELAEPVKGTMVGEMGALL